MGIGNTNLGVAGGGVAGALELSLEVAKAKADYGGLIDGYMVNKEVKKIPYQYTPTSDTTKVLYTMKDTWAGIDRVYSYNSTHVRQVPIDAGVYLYARTGGAYGFPTITLKLYKFINRELVILDDKVIPLTTSSAAHATYQNQDALQDQGNHMIMFRTGDLDAQISKVMISTQPLSVNTSYRTFRHMGIEIDKSELKINVVAMSPEGDNSYASSYARRMYDIMPWCNAFVEYKEYNYNGYVRVVKWNDDNTFSATGWVTPRSSSSWQDRSGEIKAFERSGRYFFVSAIAGDSNYGTGRVQLWEFDPIGMTITKVGAEANNPFGVVYEQTFYTATFTSSTVYLYIKTDSGSSAQVYRLTFSLNIDTGITYVTNTLEGWNSGSSTAARYFGDEPMKVPVHLAVPRRTSVEWYYDANSFHRRYDGMFSNPNWTLITASATAVFGWVNSVYDVVPGERLDVNLDAPSNYDGYYMKCLLGRYNQSGYYYPMITHYISTSTTPDYASMWNADVGEVGYMKELTTTVDFAKYGETVSAKDYNEITDGQTLDLSEYDIVLIPGMLYYTDLNGEIYTESYADQDYLSEPLGVALSESELLVRRAA